LVEVLVGSKQKAGKSLERMAAENGGDRSIEQIPLKTAAIANQQLLTEILNRKNWRDRN